MKSSSIFFHTSRKLLPGARAGKPPIFLFRTKNKRAISPFCDGICLSNPAMFRELDPPHPATRDDRKEDEQSQGQHRDPLQNGLALRWYTGNNWDNTGTGKPVVLTVIKSAGKTGLTE